jgi:hypothetical protein
MVAKIWKFFKKKVTDGQIKRKCYMIGDGIYMHGKVPKHADFTKNFQNIQNNKQKTSKHTIFRFLMHFCLTIFGQKVPEIQNMQNKMRMTNNWPILYYFMPF